MKDQTKRRFIGFAKAATLMVVSTVIGVNCAGFKTSGSLGDDSNSSSSIAGAEEIPVGYLSSDQMLKSMISVGGIETLGDLVTQDDVDIDSTYQARSGSLPSVQALGSATGPTQIAVTNLAGSVCAKVADNEIAASTPGARLFFQEVNFNSGLSIQGAAAFLPGFQRLARNAWRRDSTQEEDDMMTGFVKEFTSTSSDATQMAQTKLLAISICTSVLSSMDALTY